MEHKPTKQNKVIEGRVLDQSNQKPIPNAEVFISGTTLGTTTNKNGEFRLVSPYLPCHLGVMHVSYDAKVLVIKDENFLNIDLINKKLKIDEVLVKGKNLRKKNLRLFYKYFFYETDRTQVRILNDSVLKFHRTEYDFHVSCKSPLIIENSYLGYRVSVLLKDFFVCKRRITNNEKVPIKSPAGSAVFKLTGFYYYKEIKSKLAVDQEYYTKNRQKQYFGSLRHFLSSLYKNELEQNGFDLDCYEKQILPIHKDIRDNSGLKTYSFLTDEIEIRYFHNDRDKPINLKKSYEKYFFKVSTIISQGKEFTIRENGTSTNLPFDLKGGMANRSFVHSLPSDYSPNKLSRVTDNSELGIQ